MSEQVPEGWNKRHLSEFSTARRGTTYVSSELSEDKERFPLYINMKSFKVGGGYSENGDKYFTSPYSPNQLVQDNDLLIANTDVTDSCDILGAPAYVPREKLKNDVLFSHHVSALNISDDVSLNFLNFLMCSEHIRLEMRRYGRGTTVKMLHMRDIGKISLSIPPLPEQKKIASILTSVDEVIEKTQSQIDKLQDLKKGTMNELLTKGIGHTEFKDSELGRIPKSWEVIPLSNFVSDYKGGAALRPSDFASEGFSVIPKKAVQFGGKIILGNERTYCLDDFAEQNPSHIVNSEYVIATLRDLVPSGPSIGLVGVLEQPEEFILAQGVYGFRLNEGLVDSFLAYLSNTDWYRTLMRKIMVGSTQVHIRTGEFLDTRIPIPPYAEQLEISSIIDGYEALISSKREMLSKSNALKKSLMQDLLTGKVRVSVN